MNTSQPSRGKDHLVLCAALGVALVSLAPSFARADANPMTIHDIVTMLHVGFSSEEVEHELATRRLLQPMDGAAEATLNAAHASPHLIALLKTGLNVLSDDEAAAARQRISAGAAANSAARAALLRDAGEAASANPSHVAALLRGGKLLNCRNGSFANYDDNGLEGKKYFAFYYSAHWCGPCKRFTPQLVDFYNEMTRTHPEVEFVFVSRDHSPAEMQTYMTEAGMPWPALRYDCKSDPELNKYAGSGIPDLVLTDRGGRVLSDSFRDGRYVGPQEVLKDLARRLQPARAATAMNN